MEGLNGMGMNPSNGLMPGNFGRRLPMPGSFGTRLPIENLLFPFSGIDPLGWGFGFVVEYVSRYVELALEPLRKGKPVDDGLGSGVVADMLALCRYLES